MEQHKGIQLSKMQNYIPIYNKFFALNENNYNSINLNHHWNIVDIKESQNEVDNIYTCKLKNTILDDVVINQKVFFKMAPLLDPFKYIIGKYNTDDSDLFNLPSPFSLDKTIHPKLLDTNNSSYIDGFFGFLTSKLLNDYKFIHGIDYFGSFIAIKDNFKINVIDDLDYLIKSDFFNKNKDVLFTVEDYSHLIMDDVKPVLKPIKIFDNDNENINIDIDLNLDLDLNLGLNLGFDLEKETLNENSLEEIQDITNDNFLFDDKKTTTLKSDSTCSSRTSHTNSNDSDSEDENENENDNENDSENDKDMDDNSDCSVCDEESDYDSLNEDSCEEEKLFATIPKFPVQVICLENCEETMDELIANNTLSNDEWFSALMQIIMILITYQKLFSFTHNDLHTNNIMYSKTNIPYIYYVYKNKCYKVPTFGKIFKIIDFGRAIYKFQGKLLCSDSFQTGEDAATQYNTEPYFNDKKPRLEPNYSFDLCRLACSIFDYIVDDFDNLKQLQETNPVVKLIVEWCLDDNGINVLYKNNGIERYPDFKLYKMISRYVHNHTPSSQLNRPEFSNYLVNKLKIPKDVIIMNIDEYES
jgi:hypothetical protein